MKNSTEGSKEFPLSAALLHSSYWPQLTTNPLFVSTYHVTELVCGVLEQLWCSIAHFQASRKRDFQGKNLVKKERSSLFKGYIDLEQWQISAVSSSPFKIT